MSAANTDCCACPDPVVVSVPGTAGAAGATGAAGTNGSNAFTFTSANFIVPAINANVTVSVGYSGWMTIGQNVFVEGAGNFEVISFPGTTSVVLKYLDYTGNTHATETINSGAQVSPSGTQQALAAALPTAFTDNSTGTASNTIAAGVGVFTLVFPIQLSAMTTAAADLLTNYVVGFRFKLISISYDTTTIGAGAGGSQVLNMEIGTTNVTGGVVTITLAGTDTLGELVAGTAITANNIGTAASTLSVEVAAGGTIFTSGEGNLLIQVQNLDSADFAASTAAHINALIVALN